MGTIAPETTPPIFVPAMHFTLSKVAPKPSWGKDAGLTGTLRNLLHIKVRKKLHNSGKSKRASGYRPAHSRVAGSIIESWNDLLEQAHCPLFAIGQTAH